MAKNKFSCMTKNKDFNKCDSYKGKKKGLIHQEKQNYFEIDSLPN